MRSVAAGIVQTGLRQAQRRYATWSKSAGESFEKITRRDQQLKNQVTEIVGTLEEHVENQPNWTEALTQTFPSSSTWKHDKGPNGEQIWKLPFTGSNAHYRLLIYHSTLLGELVIDYFGKRGDDYKDKS